MLVVTFLGVETHVFFSSLGDLLNCSRKHISSTDRQKSISCLRSSFTDYFHILVFLWKWKVTNLLVDNQGWKANLMPMETRQVCPLKNPRSFFLWAQKAWTGIFVLQFLSLADVRKIQFFRLMMIRYPWFGNYRAESSCGVSVSLWRSGLWLLWQCGSISCLSGKFFNF